MVDSWTPSPYRQLDLSDVLNGEQLEAARDALLDRWGRVDVLVNAAGGNVPAAEALAGQTSRSSGSHNY